MRDEYYELTKYNSVCPRASIIYNPSDNSSIKLLYSNAFREPNIYELYYSDGYYTEDNPALEPLIINSVEFLYEQNFGYNLFGTVTCFYNKIDDIIESVLDTLTNLQQFRNNTKIITYGVELEIQSKFKSSLRNYVSFSYQRSRYPDNNNYVQNSPEYLIKGGVSYNLAKYLYFGFDIDIESGRKTVYDTWTKPFCLNNLSISFIPQSVSLNNDGNLFDRLNFTFKVNNLFDVRYELPGGPEHLQNALMQNGTNYIFEASVKF